MARPKEYDERISTAVRLPVATYEGLIDLADERDVSVNYLVTKACQRYLEAADRGIGPQ